MPKKSKNRQFLPHLVKGGRRFILCMDGALIPLQCKMGLATIQVSELFWRAKNNGQVDETAARAVVTRWV